MYILTVIPIDKGVKKEYLTYFSASMVAVGMIVSVPVRSRAIDALVIGVEPAENLKQELKDAKFQLKKINNVKGHAPFGDAFFEACTRLREYTLGSTGTIIDTLLPSVFMEKSIIESKNKIDNVDEKVETNNVKTNIEQKTTDTTNTTEIKQEKLIFQATYADRMGWYKTLIRESFSKKESVFICVPTRYDTEKFKNILSKGIEHYVFTFSHDLNKKTMLSNYQKCVDEEHPILIIGTGMFLSLPRHDIKTIILEHESSDSYKQFVRPFIDTRTFVEIFASIKKTKLIFGDTILRPETLYRRDRGELGEVAPPLFRFTNAEKQIIVDMKEETDELGKKSFSVLSSNVKQMIEMAHEQKESIFLFSVRKGLAGVTVCNDCGHTLLCPNCTSPVVLYGQKQRSATKDESGRVFMCNKCGYKEKTETRCPICTSWNLNPLGVGTDRVYEEVRKLYPHLNVIQIDKETTPTDAEARKAITKFYDTKGSILIGTEMAFYYLKDDIYASAIISVDGLFSIPSFNMTQKILHIIEKLQAITKTGIVIQTRMADNKILKNILSGNVLPLYREDLEERKMFGYPPYKKLIKITFGGTAAQGEKAREYLNKVLEKYDPQIFSAFVGKVRGEYITNTIIKVDPSLWPVPLRNGQKADEDLYKRLTAISSTFTLNIDPEDLL
jgi:primosomal protein N' (replication factor Y) (superfamily II helicase)